jgi:ketosteroid isomerase-like protein
MLIASATLPAPLAAQTTARETSLSTQRARADSAAVASSLQRFLTAFENLDWPAFRAAFSDSATIFQPSPEMAERVEGPRGIDSTFQRVFADIRKNASGGPPYHRLEPANLRIQPLSEGIVLVTFQLRNAERLARRTVVFRKEGAEWRILHLHASNMPAKP